MIKESTKDVIIEFYSKRLTTTEIASIINKEEQEVEEIKLNNIEQIKEEQEKQDKYEKFENYLIELPIPNIISILKRKNKKEVSKFIKRLMIEKRIDDAILISKIHNNNVFINNQLADLYIIKKDFDKAISIVRNNPRNLNTIQREEKIILMKKYQIDSIKENLINLKVEQARKYLLDKPRVYIQLYLEQLKKQNRIKDMIIIYNSFPQSKYNCIPFIEYYLEQNNLDQALILAKKINNGSYIRAIRYKLSKYQNIYQQNIDENYLEILELIRQKKITPEDLQNKIIDLPPMIKLIIQTASIKQNIIRNKDHLKDLNKIKHNSNDEANKKIINKLIEVFNSTKRIFEIDKYTSLIEISTEVEKSKQKIKE